MLILRRKEGQSLIVVASGCEAIFTPVHFDGEDIVVNRHDMCPLRAQELRFKDAVGTKVQVGGLSFWMELVAETSTYRFALEAPAEVRFVRTDCDEQPVAKAA